MANSINATSTGNGGIITTGDDSGVLNIQTNETTAISIDASQNLSFTNPVNTPNTFGFKNRIMNGNMAVAQRGTGAVTADGAFPVDRWIVSLSNDGAYTSQQDSSAPSGFTYSTKVAVTTADSSLSSGQYTQFRQAIEGYNTADFAWGTAGAKSITVSFWIKSSLTGTFAASIRNSSGDRSYVFTYAISSANTWEQKTVTIAGDTSGTWVTNNGVGLYLTFDLGTGSQYQTTANSWAAGNYWSTSGAVPLIGTLNANWYITGVQLEQGTQATSFDFRSYGTELTLCYRYYERFNFDSSQPLSVVQYNGTNCYGFLSFTTEKRTSPSMSDSGLTVGNSSSTTINEYYQPNPKYVRYRTAAKTSSGLSAAYQSDVCFNLSLSGWIAASAEL